MVSRIRLALFASMALPALLHAATYNCATFSVPGSSSSLITGINNAGTVVGWYDSHGFVADPVSGSYQTVDYPGAQNTRLFNINNNGLATGQYFANSGSPSAFFTFDTTNGHFTPITVAAPTSFWQQLLMEFKLKC